MRDSNINQRIRLIATGLVPALLLSACGGGATKNRGLDSVHQPVVSRTDYTLDIAKGDAGLAEGEAQRLAGWMASLRVGYGDKVAIDDPDVSDDGVRDDVTREAARYGLLVSDDAPLTRVPVAAGMVRVVVSRMKASVPGCPDYSRMRMPDFGNHTNSNYGCAVNANLAAMVANPADLVLGHTSANVADQAVSGKAIDTYRKAATTGAGGTVLKTERSGGRQ